jgi:hypothetical protein
LTFCELFFYCLYIIDFLRVILLLFVYHWLSAGYFFTVCISLTFCELFCHCFTDLVLFFTYTFNCWHAMSVIFSVLFFHCLHHLNCHYLVTYIWLRVFETLSGTGYSTSIACIHRIKFWAARQNSVARNFPAGIQEVEALIFQDSRHVKVVGCQPYAPAAFTPQEIFLALISVRGWVESGL